MRNGEIREPAAGDRMYVYTDLELSFSMSFYRSSQYYGMNRYLVILARMKAVHLYDRTMVLVKIP